MDPTQKIEQFKENLDKETVRQKALENWHIGALTGIFIIAFYLRYMPANGMKYLQAADPYYIFRMSQHIALEGHLPQLDFMRYFPYATPNYTVQLGELIIPALLYNLGFSLIFENYLEFAQFFPAMMGSLTVILMYFLGKEVFDDKKAGIAAAFILTVVSGSLRRASAGFFEKEPIGTFLMMTSLLFFTRAWKKESWPDGIVSGIALGIFTITWGGSQMLWLLYPILVGITLFINEEIKSLITSYTPTILIAALVAAASNPGRFWFTDELFIISMAFMGLLWSRYLIEQLNLIDEKYLEYYTPSVSIFGVIMLILSPFYSQWLTQKVLSFVNVAVGDTGNSVIGQTVQENAAPGIRSLATDLGSLLYGRINPGVDLIAMLVSPWNLMLISVTVLSTSILLMYARKHGLIEKQIPGKKYIAYIHAVFIPVMVFATGLVLNFIFTSIFAAMMIAASLITMVYLLKEESVLTISTMFLSGFLVALLIAVFKFSQGLGSPLSYLVLLPTATVLAATLFLQYFDSYPDKTIEYKFYMLIPLVWIISNVYGGTTRARLVFLAVFPVSLGAGYTISILTQKLQEIDYKQIKALNDNLKTQHIGKITAILVILVIAGFNLFSGFIMAQGISGSPSPSPQIWEPSLDYMDNQTPEGSVVLSWWDYGYNFQTVGRRASVADGGNLRYYSSQNHQNEPLAKYLNSTTENDTQFIQKHSADYVWLDHSMIGKFAAVSQIANQDNSNFQVISQVSTQGRLQDSLSTNGNQTVATFVGRLGRNRVQLFAPVQFTNTTASLSGPPTVRFPSGQTAKINCVLGSKGEKTTYNTTSRSLNFCIAEDPFYSLERGASGGRARGLLIPKKISDATLVELYIQDGGNVEYAEKVPQASNGYIKMWEIKE